MSQKVPAIPTGYHSVTPMVIYQDAAKAIDFYKQAFGAQELSRHIGPDGKIMHAELKIGNSMLMMGSENAEMGCLSAEALKGSPVTFYIYVDNSDSLYNRAIKTGATSKQPVEDMFWGDRCGSLADPFGLTWWIGTHIEDVSPAELKKRSEEKFSALAKA